MFYVHKSSLENKLNSCTSELDRFNKLVAQTKKGSALEKVEAIDGIFMATDQTYRTFLLPLVQTAIKLDKTNETGLVGKFILAQAQAQAMSTEPTPCHSSRDCVPVVTK